jgi:iron complex outermembrane receptor protein
MTRPVFRLAISLSVSVFALCALSETAAAQDAGTQGAPPRAGVTGNEIIVTARKRAENVQDVSESITVATGESLETLQIVNPTELTRIAPALTFRDNPMPMSSGFAVRGIGTSSFSSTIEQSVSTVVDGVVLGQPQSAASLIDINRVEVLEGPQGLLFGKNASAGLVNIVTNSPRLGAFEADASVTFGTDGEFRTHGVVNVPIGEDLAVRLVGFRNETDGYIYNEVLDESYNGEDNFGFRGKLFFEPSSEFNFLLTGDFYEDTATCCFSTVRQLGDNPRLASFLDQYGIVPGAENTSVVAGMPTGALGTDPLRRYKGLTGEANIELGSATLTLITAYRRNDYALDFDGDQTPLARFDYNGGDYEYQQFSQEIRVASAPGGTLEWLGGLYFFSSTNEIFYRAGGRLIGEAGPLIVGIIETDVDNASYAGFGSVTWNVSDAFRLRAGGRYTHDELKTRRVAYDMPGALPGSSAIIGSVAGDTTERGGANDFSWKLTAEYDLDYDIMVYASAARGYKGPGLASSGVLNPDVDPLIRPETVMAYDIGIKSTLFNGLATLNIAAFYEDFSDFQTQIYDTSTNPPGFRTTNAGSLESKGATIQATVRPAQGLSLMANAAFVDAQYKDLDGLSCPYEFTVPQLTGGCRIVGGRPVISADGNRLANAPEFKFFVAANYETPLTSTIDLLLATDYSWRDDEQFSANGDPNTVQSAYGIWNASAGLSVNEGAFELRGFVRNIADTSYTNLISPNAADTNGGYSQYLSRYQERQAGITLRARLRP